MPEAKAREIADSAEMIVNGYAFNINPQTENERKRDNPVTGL